MRLPSAAPELVTDTHRFARNTGSVMLHADKIPETAHEPPAPTCHYS